MITRSDSIADGSALINGLEEKLSSSFKPVKPDSDFVKHLKERLASTPSLRLEEDRSSGILLSILGVLAVVVGLLLGRRLWKYLFPPESSE
jgi:hypothetical protein